MVAVLCAQGVRYQACRQPDDLPGPSSLRALQVLPLQLLLQEAEPGRADGSIVHSLPFGWQEIQRGVLISLLVRRLLSSHSKPLS